MTCPLAVFSPHLGALSETFIRQAMEALLPGGTVVVAGTAAPPYAGHWTVPSPTLVLDEIAPLRLRQELGRALAEKLGARPPERRRAVLEAFLTHHGVTTILSEYLDVSLPWVDLARRLGIRFFVRAHGYDTSERLRSTEWCRRYLRYNDADGIFTVSQFSRRRLIDLGLDPDKIRVIPCGVQVPVAPPSRSSAGPIRCLAVGRLVTKKAPILLLDAFRRALIMCPGLHLDVVGAGPLLSSVKHFARAFSLEADITFHGGQPHSAVLELMRSADIFVQHSIVDPDTGDEEGLPVSILEAMAHALPVVSTRHAGIPEAVVDSVTGHLVDEGDSVGMGDHLAALARDPDARARLGNAGWVRARDRFSWTLSRTLLLHELGFAEAAPV